MNRDADVPEPQPARTAEKGTGRHPRVPPCTLRRTCSRRRQHASSQVVSLRQRPCPRQRVPTAAALATPGTGAGRFRAVRTEPGRQPGHGSRVQHERRRGPRADRGMLFPPVHLACSGRVPALQVPPARVACGAAARCVGEPYFSAVPLTSRRSRGTSRHGGLLWAARAVPFRSSRPRRKLTGRIPESRFCGSTPV